MDKYLEGETQYQADTQESDTNPQRNARESMLHRTSFKIDYDEYLKWLRLDFQNNFNIDTALDGKIELLEKSSKMAESSVLGIKNKYKYLY